MSDNTNKKSDLAPFKNKERFYSKTRVLEIAGLSLIMVCLCVWLSSCYTMRIGHSDTALWYLFGKNFLSDFAIQKVAFGFPLLIYIFSKIVGSIPAFMVNIPVLMFLIPVFYYFTKRHWPNKDDHEDSLLAVVCGCISIVAFVIINKNVLLVLANPLRDPLSWVMMLLSAVCVIRFVEERAHHYRWLAAAGLSLVYAVSCRETAIVLAVPLFIYAVYSKIKDNSIPFWRALLVFLTACVCFAVPYLVQNYRTTGNPFLPGQFVLQGWPSPFRVAFFKLIYFDILVFFFRRYSLFLIFAFVGCIKAYKDNNRIPLTISLPSIIAFYFFYAFILTKSIWRYLMVVDFFILPLASLGLTTCFQFIIRQFLHSSLKRTAVLRATILMLFILGAVFSVTGRYGDTDRFTVTKAKALGELLENSIPPHQQVFIEGRGFSSLVRCCTSLNTIDISPEEFLNEMSEYNVETNHASYVIFTSSDLQRNFEREFTLTDVKTFSARDFNIHKLINAEQVFIGRIIPWATLSSETSVKSESKGKHILQVDFGRLSKTPRTFLNTVFDDTVLSTNSPDFTSFYLVDINAVSNSHIVHAESDGCIPSSLHATLQPLSEPLTMHFNPKRVGGLANRIVPPLLRQEKGKVTISQSRRILVPTFERNDAVFIFDIICSVDNYEPENPPDLLIEAGSSILFDNTLPGQSLRHIICAVPGSKIDSNDTVLSFRTKNLPEGQPQKVVLHSVTIARKDLRDDYGIVCEKGSDNIGIEGIYPLEYRNDKPENGWCWTKGLAKALLFLKAGTTPVDITVGYFDENRPAAIDGPSPTFSIDGKNYPAQQSERELNGMKYLESRLILPPECFSNNICTLEISCRTWVPRNLNINNDDRTLGLMLHSITAARE